MVRCVEYPAKRSIRPEGHQGENWKVVYAILAMQIEIAQKQKGK
jgi:hypothetical protein